MFPNLVRIDRYQGNQDREWEQVNSWLRNGDCPLDLYDMLLSIYPSLYLVASC